jgi:hypothetical protein
VAEDKAGQKNLDLAVRSQERFETYLLGLTFTLLGASVQTAHFGQFFVADILEWTGWLGLLTAGLIGLWRMERRSKFYHVASAVEAARGRATPVQEALAIGQSPILIDRATRKPVDPIRLAGQGRERSRAR